MRSNAILATATLTVALFAAAVSTYAGSQKKAGDVVEPTVCTMDINEHNQASKCECPPKYVYDNIEGNCKLVKPVKDDKVTDKDGNKDVPSGQQAGGNEQRLNRSDKKKAH